MRQEWFETNRLSWDERVPIHLQSAFYDLSGFKSGKNTLHPFELEELGSVEGSSLVHLQCHFGLDTLSWARLGAQVTGLDFSLPAVEAATQVAEDLGLPARFVHANVYQAPEALQATYDVVYTGRGALIWLPDLSAWAEVVASLLNPGGRFYLHEFHPFADVFAEDSLEVVDGYFHESEPRRWEGSGTYADTEADTAHNTSLEWKHPLGDVVTVLARVGLRIELLRERRGGSHFRRWPFMVESESGELVLPERMPALPLTYSLLASKPG
jgi:SAM-dependent methyltransferase